MENCPLEQGAGLGVFSGVIQSSVGRRKGRWMQRRKLTKVCYKWHNDPIYFGSN